MPNRDGAKEIYNFIASETRKEIDRVYSVVAYSLVDLADELAKKSPADTSTLVSNYKFGTKRQDWVYSGRPLSRGSGGSSKGSSRAKLKNQNNTKAKRAIEKIKSLPDKAVYNIRHRLGLQNNTPYLAEALAKNNLSFTSLVNAWFSKLNAKLSSNAPK